MTGPFDLGTSLALPAVSGRDESHAAVAGALREVHDSAWQAVDRRVLELCGRRIAMILGADPALVAPAGRGTSSSPASFEGDELARWYESGPFDDRDKACIAFAEQFAVDVATLDDRLANAVTSHLGEDGLVNLTSALLVVEQRLRMHLTWRALFEPEEAT